MPEVTVTIYAGTPECHPPEADASIKIYENVTGNISLSNNPQGNELYWCSVKINGVSAYSGNLAAGDNADFEADVSGDPGVTEFTARGSCYSTRRHRTSRGEDAKTMNEWCEPLLFTFDLSLNWSAVIDYDLHLLTPEGEVLYSNPVVGTLQLNHDAYPSCNEEGNTPPELITGTSSKAGTYRPYWVTFNACEGATETPVFAGTLKITSETGAKVNGSFYPFNSEITLSNGADYDIQPPDPPP
jgi:hypothetical protein